MRYSILCLLLLLHFGGNAQKVCIYVPAPPRPIDLYNDIKNKITEEGDTASYEKLKKIYKDTIEFGEDFFLYAFIMAEVHNNPQACYDVFTYIVDFYPFQDQVMDEKMAELAITFLLKSSKQGHLKAKEITKKYSIKANSKNDSEQIERIIKGEGIPLFWKQMTPRSTEDTTTQR